MDQEFIKEDNISSRQKQWISHIGWDIKRITIQKIEFINFIDNTYNINKLSDPQKNSISILAKNYKKVLQKRVSRSGSSSSSDYF